MPGIDRPAIAALCPTARRNRSCSILAPLIGADAPISSISPYGAARWRKCWSDLERPKIGLLNIGVDEVKGLDEVG